MNASQILFQPTHSAPLDHELAALTLQLEEFGIFADAGKGKHAIDNPPDAEVAFAAFQAELEYYQEFLRDQKLAQSIGAAVHTDGLLIGDLTTRDLQTHDDRRVALEMSTNDLEIEKPPLDMDFVCQKDMDDWMSVLAESQAATSIADFSDVESEAGPSMTYTERQADILKKLSTKFACTACTDRFPRASMVLLPCNDRYCPSCIKTLFHRSIRDAGLYPPKCCRRPIPLELVARHMGAEELAAFQLAQIENATRNKTYCSNRDCGVFIVPSLIEPGTRRATCQQCRTETCAICNNTYHEDAECPEDTSLQETRDLARSQGWQTCYMCDRLVELLTGCNHMRCHCGADFCYVCGARWKNCPCATADPGRIEERAIEIVNRTGRDLPEHEHRRRVEEVFANLQENHECVHSRRFQRVEWPTPRRGFRCEMCDARHYGYILQCRRCAVRVCEDCRRHRT